MSHFPARTVKRKCFAEEAIYRTSLLFLPSIGGRQSIFCSLPVVFEFPFPNIAFRNTSGSWVLDYIKRSELDQRVFHNSFVDPAEKLDLLIKSNILDKSCYQGASIGKKSFRYNSFGLAMSA